MATANTNDHDQEAQRIYESVKAYYGTCLHQTSDLQTSTCTEHERPHPIIAGAIQKIPDEVLAQFYGCGTPIPLGITGLDVLDLGSGSGRDAYVVSALVGPQGSVTGIDMTAELLTIAQHHIEVFTKRLGYATPNLTFVEGFIECLDQAGIPSESKHLVISNCVINLSPHKDQVLKEVFRVLRVGGEFYFSDVYATRRLAEKARHHDVLLGECVGGATYVEDFKELSRQVGFGEPRLLRIAPIEIQNEELEALVGATQFYSMTFRCFKVPHMEFREKEEDYGHVATYLGTIPGHPHVYDLDVTHRFETRRPVRVGGNTAAILKHGWLREYFKVEGDWSEHFGLFETSGLGGSGTVVKQQTSTISVGNMSTSMAKKWC